MQIAWRAADDIQQAGERGPRVYDSGGEEVQDARVAAQGLEDGEQAGDAVGLQESGEVGEGGDEDDACEGGGGLWECFGRHEVLGEVWGERVREVQGAGGGDGGAEALAEEDGAAGGLVEGRLDVGEEGDGVGDDAGFGGDVGLVGEGGEAEAPVVAG